MYARQITNEETYTLREAKRIINVEHKTKRELLLYKAKSLQIKTVRKPTQQKPNGIRTSGLSRAMLAMELASLF